MQLPTLLASTNSFQYKSDIPRTLSLLEKCSNTDGIKQIHATVIKNGLVFDPLTLSRLLAASASPATGDLSYAHKLFDEITNRNTSMWNAMIRGYSDGRRPEESLALYIQMIFHSVPHNSHTFPFLLKAFTDSSFLGETVQLHSHIVKFGFGVEVFALNSLIRAYAACGDIKSASLVFARASRRDPVTWNSMIDAYVKSDEMEMAYGVFIEMPGKNVVSWTTMISGFASADLNYEALRLFREMQIEGIEPDAAALGSALSACANLGAVEQGRYIHRLIERGRIKTDAMLECGLIDMYAKSGEIEEAIRVFLKSKMKNVSIWTAVISGLGIHGRAREALYWFSEMQKEGIKPNLVTFTAILSACGYVGLVEEGRALFNSIRSIHGLTPSMEHYGCLVDLLGRAGLLDEAIEVVNTMPMEPNAIVLGALLNACRVRGNLELGKAIGERLMKRDPGHGGRYLQAASVFGAKGEWKAAAKIRETMNEKGIRKTPGISSITLDGTVHEFIAGDDSHPCIKEIHEVWNRVLGRLREEGYRPEIGNLVLDLDDGEKEVAISRHSEKLAMAFGLIRTEEKVSLRIFKNLRVCEDCHKVAKMVSRIYEREIIMRDRVRFHVFRNGICSCGDYW